MVDLPSYKMAIFHSYVSLPEDNKEILEPLSSQVLVRFCVLQSRHVAGVPEIQNCLVATW